MSTAKPDEKTTPASAGSDGSATGGKYSATLIVHTPSGPVAACESHAAKLKALMAFMGAYTNATPAPEGAECPNCRNDDDRHETET